MGNPSLIAKLGIDESDFKRGLEASESRLQQTQEKAKLLAAQVALLQVEMAKENSGKGTQLQTEQYKGLETALRNARKEAKDMATQLAALDAVKPPAPQVQAMPASSRPQAVIVRGYAGAEESQGGHGGNNAMRNAELMHSGRAMADMLAAGMSPVQAFMAESPRLFQAFASSLSGVLVPIAALVGGGLFVKWLTDAETKAKGLREETSLIALNVNNLAGAGIKELGQSLAAANAQVAKVTEARNGFGNKMVNLLTGGGVNDADVRAAMGQRGKVENQLSATGTREVSFRQREADGDPGVAAEKLQAEFAEKRNEIYRQVAAGKLQDGNAAIALAQRELDIELDLLNRTKTFKENELALETQLLSIRRYGKDVAVENARARMEKAKADLEAGPQDGPEREANLRKYQGAQTDHDDAGQQQKESDASIDLRTRNANLRGSADQVAYEQATNNRDAIQNKLDDPATKPDEAKKLRADLAEAKARLATLAKGTNEKGIEIQKLGVHAETGRGSQAELDAAEKMLQIIEQQRTLNKEKNGDDALVSAQLNDQAAELLKRKADILFNEKQSLAAAKAQTTEMTLQSNGHGSMAQVVAVRAQYEERIAKALHDGNTELAAQLQKQQQIALIAPEAAAADETPAQQAAAERGATAQKKAAQNFEDRHGTHDADRQGSMIHNADGPGGSVIPTAGAGPNSAAESPDNAAFPGFADIGNQHMAPRPITVPNRSDALNEGAQNAGKGDGGLNDKGIIAAQKETTTAVKEINFKNK